MKILELYEKMATIRNEYWDVRNYGLCRKYNEVFTQLLAITFSNEYHTDTLPGVFSLVDISLSYKEIQILLERMGLNVNVKLTTSISERGNSFQVTQI